VDSRGKRDALIVALLSFVDEERLLREVAPLEQKLSDEERHRNALNLPTLYSRPEVDLKKSMLYGLLPEALTMETSKDGVSSSKFEVPPSDQSSIGPLASAKYNPSDLSQSDFDYVDDSPSYIKACRVIKTLSCMQCGEFGHRLKDCPLTVHKPADKI